MMKKYILSFLACCFYGCTATVAASDGLLSTPSAFSVRETADRFEQLLKSKGLTLFARIDHAKNAAGVNLKLNATETIIFGNPKVGTPLMQCAQEVAIDLPQKVLFWQDNNGKVWLSYNAPSYLKKRHQIKGCDEVIKKISKVLNLLSKAATSS